MRREYGDDGGAASAAAHRASLLRHFRHARRLLDDFRPEVVIIWGDDQHENFTDDIIPPFCSSPTTGRSAALAARGQRAQHLGRGPEHGVPIRGTGGWQAPARQLLDQGVDMAYAYSLHYPGSPTRSSTRLS
jgi:hypothetical protein